MQSTLPVLIYASDLDTYHYPSACPFKTERAAETRRILQTSGNAFFREEKPRYATDDELLQFHTAAY